MKRTVAYIRKSLIDHYSHLEIEAFIDIIFNNIYNYSKKDFIIHSSETLSVKDIQKIENIVKRLKNFEPIQYIFEIADFYGLKFNVNSNVLIPRNETEELVHLVLNQHNNEGIKLLDMGTGSGCIPISLKKNNPLLSISACDISVAALEVAKINAERNNTPIEFFVFDILSEKALPENTYDLIISNPPYITEREKELMLPNVLENEPHLALFVPDNEPLLFYNAVTQKAISALKPSGEIYFEINEAYGMDVKQLLEKNNFSATICKDLNGKDRIVWGKLRE